MAFTITAWIYIGLGFLGATPRLYAYPVIALILYALLRDRPWLLAVTTIVSGMLYPIVATIAGLCLASWLLVKPLSAQGSVAHWRWSRRLATVALTGFLTLAGLLPMWLDSQPYGRRVVAADIARYPEAGPEGNYRAYNQLPYKLFGNEWATYFVGPLYSHGDPIAPWFNIHKKLAPAGLLFVFAVTSLVIVIVICAGVRVMLKEDSRDSAQRLIGFFVVCLVLHVIAWLGAPHLYIPTRFFMYSLPFLITLILPWSIYLLLGRVTRLRSSAKLRSLTFLAIIAIYLMAFGGRGNVEFASSSEHQLPKPIADAIAALPKDVLIAGWPAATIRNVEYTPPQRFFDRGDTSCAAFDLYEPDARTDERHVRRLLKRRCRAAHPLATEFGVTHLLVETRDFTDPNHAPEYFAPWRERIAPRLAEIKGKEYLMNPTLHQKAAMFNHDGMILLDLGKLP